MGEYLVIQSEDELYHHGILGMKWGVRRFQNPDGSLKAAGRKRYGNDGGDKNFFKAFNKAHRDANRESRAKARAERNQARKDKLAAVGVKAKNKAKEAGKFAKEASEPTIKTKNGYITPAEKMGRDAGGVARNSQKLSQQIGYLRGAKKREEQRQAMQKMSNKELQDRITRMRLEQQYEDLSGQQVSKGQQRVDAALGLTLTALEIGTGVAAIAGTVHMIRKGGKE